jgi:DNA-directed RNA polymerase specialized sigma subunit
MLHEVGEELNSSREVPTIVDEVARGEDDFDILEAEETVEVLFEVVKELPLVQQNVVLLRYPLYPHWRTYSDVQIGTMLGISPTWVGELRKQAFASLREKIHQLNLR